MIKSIHRFAIASALLVLGASASAITIKGADGVAVELSAPPKRVVALNSSVAETIAALGKGETIVGRDVTVQYPKSVADNAKNLGHWARVPAEGIIALKPDLVIAPDDSFTTAKDNPLKKQLRDAGIKVLALPHTGSTGVSGFRSRVNMISEVYGTKAEGERLMQNFTKGLSKARASAPSKAPRVLFLYAHGPNDASIYGRGNGGDALLTLAGGRNIVNYAGTKKLTSEGMVALNPDAIVMLNRGWEAVGGEEGLLKMPGVAQTNAGKNKRFYQVDDSIRWIGPRLPEFAQKLSAEWKKDFN